MLKVYCEMPAHLSQAMARVVRALKQYAPKNIGFVSNVNNAELVVLHAIGYPEIQDAVQRIKDAGQSYAVIQYCLRSTQRPRTGAWKMIWQNAEVVWSYYDLKRLQVEDHSVFSFPFYFAPLGVDDIFKSSVHRIKTYTILTSGYVAESETVHECAEAVRRVGGIFFHLGPRNVVAADAYGQSLSDDQLARVYAQCKWVAGLRRCEGFEMPAAEGLLCRARPILFDRPHYRAWFSRWGVFIPEGNFADTVDSLVQVFKRGLEPITEQERRDAIGQFSWNPIISGFWAAVGATTRA